jgi:hypothetical protein
MARRSLLTPPATYEHDSWPTLRRAARVLDIYAIAALAGGLLFVICAALFASFHL